MCIFSLLFFRLQLNERLFGWAQLHSAVSSVYVFNAKTYTIRIHFLFVGRDVFHHHTSESSEVFRMNNDVYANVIKR